MSIIATATAAAPHAPWWGVFVFMAAFVAFVALTGWAASRGIVTPAAPADVSPSTATTAAAVTITRV